MKNLIIKTTSEYNANLGTYKPVSHYFGSMNDRINYRGTKPVYHITMNHGTDKQLSREQRQDRYEVSCLEKGKRPYNYPQNLWEEYLRDVQSEEHTNKCEARDAWKYEN